MVFASGAFNCDGELVLAGPGVVRPDEGVVMQLIGRREVWFAGRIEGVRTVDVGFFYVRFMKRGGTRVLRIRVSPKHGGARMV
jgi:hypothetical protein